MKYIWFLLTLICLNSGIFPEDIPQKEQPNEPQGLSTDTAKKFALEDIIQITWLDLAFVNFYPLPKTRFADFSDANFGGEVRLNFMIFNIKPLWISANFLMDFNKTNSIRLDTITDMAVSIGAGWRFTLLPRFFLTPRLAYGYMLHSTYGDYYNDPIIYPADFRAGKKANLIFSDTYMHYEAEFAYDISPESRQIESEIFFSPSFIHFIEKVRQGFEFGYMIGIRAKVKTLFASIPGKVEKPMEQKLETVEIKMNPAILAGKVVEADTNLLFEDTLPTITGGKAEKTDILKGETFAYTVEPGKNVSLKAEREGYDSATQQVDGSTLISDNRTSVILSLKKILEWGILGHVHELNTDEPIVDVHTYIKERPVENQVWPVEEMQKIADTDKLTSNDKGDYRKKLDKNINYDILLMKKGYFTVRAVFMTEEKKPGWHDVTSLMNTPIQKAVVGAVMQFGNILFDSGSWIIRKDSIPVLDKMVQFLFDNPKIIVELGAHTDSMGPANENLILSQRRAQSAVAYLIKSGVPKSHISAKGYGESKLTNRCSDGVPCSAAEHQANRRTELTAKEILPE